MNHAFFIPAAIAALGLIVASTAADAAAWRSFGYPAHHTDLVSAKNDAGTAAFNLHCLPGNNDVELQMIGGPAGKNTTLTLSVDGKTVARHAAFVTQIGSTAWIDFGGPSAADGDVMRWLQGIASATRDITISAGRGAAHFSADGAHSAAATALSYCNLR